MAISQPAADELISYYFRQQKPYHIILSYLRCKHQISVSMSWLKRRMRYLGLARRGQRMRWDSASLIKQCVEMELKRCHGLLGYRAVWDTLRNDYGLHVRRDTVMNLISQLDPVGARQRRRKRLKRRVYCCKGPNEIWHIDGNDKLRTYGFCIHGCIDGYSRKMLWLEVSSTNHNPRIVVDYYLNAIDKYKGCPRLVRSDYGTENCYLAATQIALRIDHTDTYAGNKSYRYGKSTTNTRIEGWWSILKKSKLLFWMEHFERFVADGTFNPNNTLHKQCLAYCYFHILEQDLHGFRTNWNRHYIRKTHGSRCPPGVPNDLHTLPEITGTENYLCTDLDGEVWLTAKLLYASKPPPFYTRDFKESCDAEVLSRFGLRQSDITLDNADDIYLHLVS